MSKNERALPENKTSSKRQAVLRRLLSIKRVPAISASAAARRSIAFGDKCRDVRDWSNAARAYRRGLALEPRDFGVWIQLGHVLKENGLINQAEMAYLQAFEIEDKNADLHVQLGHFYSLSQQTSKADEHYRRALALGSTDPIAMVSAHPRNDVTHPNMAVDFFRRADDCRDARQWAEAAVWYERGLALKPETFPFWVQLGHVLKESGLMLKAEAAYLRALELHYNDGDLAIQLGHLYAQMNDHVRAADNYARAIGLGMRDRNALSFLTRQPEHYLSLKLALLRTDPEKLDRLTVLAASDVGLSFAQFILRHTNLLA